MKNILFPTDFSEAANKAFIYALNLADKFNARLTTLHVYRKPDLSAEVHLPVKLAEFYDSMDLLEFESYRDAIPVLRDIAEENGFGHLEIKHVLEEGDSIVETIMRIADKDAADMIVLGTTGARGLKQILIGSIAGELLENANCPVLAVPENSTFDGVIDQIVFTTAYQESDKLALKKVLELAKAFEASVQCINVDLAHTDELTGRMDKFKAAFASTDNIDFAVLDGTDMRKVIMDYVDKHHVDILAMVTQKRSFLEELFHYSKTKAMSYHANTPILSIQTHTLILEHIIN